MLRRDVIETIIESRAHHWWFQEESRSRQAGQIAAAHILQRITEMGAVILSWCQCAVNTGT